MLISRGIAVDARSARPLQATQGPVSWPRVRGASDIQCMPTYEFRCRTCGSSHSPVPPAPAVWTRCARRPDRGRCHPGRPAARRHNRPAGQPPPQFPAHYTPVFARRFLLAFLDLSADRQPRHSGRYAATLRTCRTSAEGSSPPAARGTERHGPWCQTSCHLASWAPWATAFRAR